MQISTINVEVKEQNSSKNFTKHVFMMERRYKHRSKGWHGMTNSFPTLPTTLVFFFCYSTKGLISDSFIFDLKLPHGIWDPHNDILFG